MIPEFGQVYRIPRFKHNDPNVAGHWVVLLFADKNSNKIYYQTLGSRMFKIFPNFGSFKNEHCYNCSTHRHLAYYLRYKKNPRLVLDVDVIEFLNYNKYQFLFKETFLCMKDVIKNDIYFDFESKVNKGIYKCHGSLLNQNKKGTLLAMRNSNGISPFEQSSIINFAKAALISP
jgi:hypothetical protein